LSSGKELVQSSLAPLPGFRKGAFGEFILNSLPEHLFNDRKHSFTRPDCKECPLGCEDAANYFLAYQQASVRRYCTKRCVMLYHGLAHFIEEKLGITKKGPFGDGFD
jgi:hypothetical protein